MLQSQHKKKATLPNGSVAFNLFMKMLFRLAHITRATAVNHWHKDFLSSAVAINKNKEDIARMPGRVSHGITHAHLSYAMPLGLLLGGKHLGICNELLTITCRYAVALIMPIYKRLILALQQLFVIHLGCLGGELLRSRT